MPQGLLVALDLGAEARERLGRLISDLGLRPVLGADAAVLDIDSTALVCFGEQEGAQFGYNGKGRRRRRHFPLVASVAGACTVVLAKYRDGGGIDATETIAFLSEAVARTRAAMAEEARLMVRADSGFWSKALANWLLEEGVPFIISMPLQPAVKLMLHKVQWQRLADDPDIEVGAIVGADLGLDCRLRVITVRRRLHDPKAPPPGKELPGCTRWRYQAFVTSILSWSLVDCWRFYCHRGDCERVFRDARQALGLGWLVSHRFDRNAVAFLLRMLALNVDRLFQRHVEERARNSGEDRKRGREGIIARQSWFYRTAGRLLRSGGAYLLRVRDNAAVLRGWLYYALDLVEQST